MVLSKNKKNAFKTSYNGHNSSENSKFSRGNPKSPPTTTTQIQDYSDFKTLQLHGNESEH